MRPVAFLHDWLVSYRGGEKVLDCLLKLYPHAPVYTLFYDPQKMPEVINEREIRSPWFLRYLRKFRKALLPVFPLIMHYWPRQKYDLLISTSSCVAKSAKAGTHICYIHSPMRYIWDQEEIYLEPLKKWVLLSHMIKLINKALRRWDRRTASRVDHFICNSNFVARRVKRFYGRESVVIHPPIEDDFFSFPKTEKKDYYIAAGALVWYKRFDLAIEACEQMNRPLIIAGSGPYINQLRKMAGPMTTILEGPNDTEFRKLIAGAQALLFPGIEDFGMIAIEAMALGTPVIAYRDGGALDFIRPETGMFFTEQNPVTICKTIEAFEKTKYSYEKLRGFALNFRRSRFMENFSEEVRKVLESKHD